MSKLSAWLARILWWFILRRMRLPGVKAFQRRFRSRLPQPYAAKIRASMKRQDQFARRHGLKLLTFSLNIMFASFAITAMYQFAMWLVETNVIILPDDFRQKLGR